MKLPPQDPGTKRRNLGHPPCHLGLETRCKLARSIEGEHLRMLRLFSGPPAPLSDRQVWTSIFRLSTYSRVFCCFGQPLDQEFGRSGSREKSKPAPSNTTRMRHAKPS